MGFLKILKILFKTLVFLLLLLFPPFLVYYILKNNLKKLVAVAIVIVIAIVIIVLLCFPQKYLIIPIFIVYLIICLLVGCNESNKDIIKKICKKLKNFNFKELNFLFLLIILWCLLVILIIPTISFIDGDVIKTISQPIAMLDNQTMIFIHNATSYTSNDFKETDLIKSVGSFITIILSLTTLYMFNLINNTLSKYSLGVINLILKKDERIWGLLYFAFNILLVEILLMMFPSITIFIIVNLVIIALLIWQIRGIDEYIKPKYYMDTLKNDIIDRLKEQSKESCRNHINYMKKYYCNIGLNDNSIFNDIKTNERYYNSRYYNGNENYKGINGYEFVLNDAFISLRDLIRKAVNEKDDTLLTLCGVVIHKIAEEIPENEDILNEDILFEIICNIIILDILIPSYDNKWIYGIRIARDLLNLDKIRNKFGKIDNMNEIKKVIKEYNEKVGLKFDEGDNGSGTH